MEQRLQPKDVRLIAVCVGITAISLLIGTHYFYEAFPEATIDFRLTRDEARDKGHSFLRHRGIDVQGYRHSGIFEYDNQAKTFLERERGLEGATDLIGDPVRLWRWSSRWVKELQKEEFRVQYTTTGELVGFAHLIEEEEKGASLDQATARHTAERFLQHTLQRDLATLEFVEAETTQRPQRTDHAFTWKLRGFEIEEATYRFRVGVQGDLESVGRSQPADGRQQERGGHVSDDVNRRGVAGKGLPAGPDAADELAPQLQQPPAGCRTIRGRVPGLGMSLALTKVAPQGAR